MNFAELGLSKLILTAVQEFGYVKPTEIQENTIPLIISGRDVMASAQTGSGKTAAFALPVIECLQEPDKKPRALILVPTRELALQVEEQFFQFGSSSGLRTVTLYGGTGYDSQSRALKKGVDIIVATPGRLLDFVERKVADLSRIEMLIMDEADRLLDMGFMPQVRRIVSKISKDRQTIMFSATIDHQVERIAAEYLIDPVTVRVNTKQIEPTEIDQKIFHVHEFSKDDLLAKLIEELQMSSVLVFTKTRRKATWVKDRLREKNVRAEEIHGDITQKQRETTLARYREGKFPVLVATDVAARGLDIPTISHVVNYDLPEAAEDYVHRIGRTGRAGRTGVALSFVSEEQRYLIRDIEKLIGKQLDLTAPVRKSGPIGVRRFGPSSRRRII
jgi:ATP-dependent RNA helicase RhlE